MTPTDLNPARSEKYRYLEKFSYLPKLIILASIAMIVSMLALMMAWMAVYDSTHVKVQQQVVLESNVILVKEIRVLQNKIDRYEANLHANEDH